MVVRRRIGSGVVLGALVALATLLAGAPAHASGQTICVALVVDFGDLGGGVDTSCATVRSGSTGYDVLEAGGHTFAICSNGVLGSIDGKPKDGCTQKNDSVHYWSYWHRAPGSSSWTYSAEGAGTYQPRANSTEGWRWMKSPPPNVPYTQICRPTPSPTATRVSSAPRRTSATTPATAPNGVGATAAASATKTADARRRQSRAARRSTPLASPTPSVTPSTATPAPTATAAGPVGDAGDSGGGPPTALIGGVAAAFALGGGAWWRARRTGPAP